MVNALSALRHEADGKSVRLSCSMGVTTIAECVEDEPTLAMLREFGVDYVQGYHLGRPQEALPGSGAQPGSVQR